MTTTRLGKLISGALLSGCAWVAACSTTTPGATEAQFAQAKSQEQRGAELFAEECAACHGPRGQGASAPDVMGSHALPTYPAEPTSASDPALMDPEALRLREQTRGVGVGTRDPFENAADLFRYISAQMPKPDARAGSLTNDEYWAILNFMLLAHGAPVPDGGLTPANAESVPIHAD